MALANVSVGVLTCIGAAYISFGLLVCLYARRDLEKYSSPCLIQMRLHINSSMVASMGSESTEAE